MADRAKFLDFLDMIDGGGRGKMGGEFKGGGIISQIANLLATPYGSEDPVRRKQRQKALGLLDKIGTKEEQASAASRAAATPSVVTKPAPEAPVVSAGPTTRGGQRGPRVVPAGPPMPATAMSPVMPNQPMPSYDQIMQQATPVQPVGPSTRGGRRGATSAAVPVSGGYQAVPAMTNYNPTVPAMARGIAAGDQFSPVFSQDYADYLEYLNTGRYPRG